MIKRDFIIEYNKKVKKSRTKILIIWALVTALVLGALVIAVINLNPDDPIFDVAIPISAFALIILFVLLKFQQNPRRIYKEVYPTIIAGINNEYNEGIQYFTGKPKELVKGSAFKEIKALNSCDIKYKITYFSRLKRNVEIYCGELTAPIIHYWPRSGFHIFVENEDFNEHSFFQDSFVVTQGVTTEKNRGSALEQKYQEVFQKIKSKSPNTAVYLSGLNGRIYVMIEHPQGYRNIKYLNEESYEKIKKQLLLIFNVSRSVDISGDASND